MEVVAFSVESRLARTERPKLQKMNLPTPEARDQVLVLNINYTQAGRFRYLKLESKTGNYCYLITSVIC